MAVAIIIPYRTAASPYAGPLARMGCVADGIPGSCRQEQRLYETKTNRSVAPIAERYSPRRTLHCVLVVKLTWLRWRHPGKARDAHQSRSTLCDHIERRELLRGAKVA